ncbi:MAG: PspC domain-containing protein [Acidimicrobiales bacterium]|jgi:phage shock protein PspC (stress-responsive transcriptional regulator)
MRTETNQEHQDRRLRRAADGRILGGVAAGLAKYLDVDVAHVRIVFVALSLFGGAGVPLYLAAWVLIPEEGSDVAIADGVMHHAGAGLS